MPSSLSKGRKTSFNTTCSALCLAAALLALAVPARAQTPVTSTAPVASDAPAASAAPAAPDTALLVYDAGNPAMAREDVERLCEIMTALGKQLTFGDIGAYRDALGEYGYVICYRLEEIGEGELRALCDYGGELMVMGSGLMRRMLLATGRGERVVWQSDADKGVLRLTLDAQTPFEAIVETAKIARFDGEAVGEGTLDVQGARCPLFCRVDGVIVTPATSLAQPLMRAAMTRALSQLMWPYEGAAPAYGQALVLDSIYPFMDPQALLALVDALEGGGVPYVLSVMPVYRNASYPAMAQFCQVLRYAQASGGFIILRAPFEQAVTRDEDALHQALTDALRAYTDNGVYPLGIEVPLRWTNDAFYLNALMRYRTVFVRDTGEASGFSLEAGRNALVDGGHQLITPSIALDGTGVSFLSCYPAAVYVDAYETDASQLAALTDAMRRQRAPFQDFWALSHAVWGDGLNLQYEGGRLFLSGEEVAVTFEPSEYDEAYDYNRDIVSRITVSLRRQNRALIAATAVILTAFAAFIAYLRRMNRRSFFS